MAIPCPIKKIFQEKKQRIDANNFTDWGKLVFALKKNILIYQAQFTRQDWLEIKQQVASHQEQLAKKTNFLKSYRHLLFH